MYDGQNKNYIDARDMFKQCPKCKKIWMRVYGCDSIICGNLLDRNHYYDNIINKDKKLYKYEFKI